ncbi:MAG: AraC family transcriptional regulator [Flavobacterium sp.]
MIKDLLNSELQELPIEGLDIHIIKKYVIKTAANESFTVKNLSILLIKSGSFKLMLQEIVQNLSPHDLLVIPENSFCTILEVHDKLQFFLISFSSEFAFKNSFKKELVDSFYFLIRNQPIRTALDEKEFMVLSLIYKLIYFVNKDAGVNGFDNELQRISLNLFLYELKLIYAKDNAENASNFTRKESLVIQFLTILSIHYKKHHNVKFYSGSLYVTPEHLNKSVKQITGKTVKAMIIEALVIEAKILLEDLQFSITEIAQELEFNSTSTFGIFFKKHTSISPTEYRSNSIVRFKSR